MTRRRDRNQQRPADLATAAALAYACPDCAATTELVQLSPGLAELTVHHDDTCPNYRAMTKGTQP